MGKIVAIFLLIFVFIAIPFVVFLGKENIEKNKISLKPKEVIITATPKPTAAADLSYISINTDDFVNPKLLNSEGKQVGDISTKSATSSSEVEMDSSKTLYYPRPESGSYSATLISPKKFNAQIILDDSNGNPHIYKLTKDAGTLRYIIVFDKQNSASSNISVVK